MAYVHSEPEKPERRTLLPIENAVEPIRAIVDTPPLDDRAAKFFAWERCKRNSVHQQE
jgi:hypothetical protein